MVNSLAVETFVENDLQASDRVLAEIDQFPRLPEQILSLLNHAASRGQRRFHDDIVSPPPHVLTDATMSGAGADAPEREDRLHVTRSLMKLMGDENRNTSRRSELAAFWRHSLATACAASLAASKIRRQIRPQAAYYSGFLHDIGKAALAAVFPKSFARLTRDPPSHFTTSSELERGIFETDHSIVGRRLACRWRLPQPFVDCIWMHHSPVDALPRSVASAGHVQLIAFANTLAHELGYYFVTNSLGDASSGVIARSLGLAAEAIEEIAASLPEEVAFYERELGLDDIASGPGSIRQLCRSLDQLTESNSTLLRQQTRARRIGRMMSIINLFNQRIDLGTSTADLCKVAAETIKGFFQAEGVVAFFDRPAIGALNVGLAGDDRELYELIEAPEGLVFEHSPEVSLPEFTRPVPLPRELHGLLGRYRTWLDGGDTFYLRFVNAEQVIGGAIISLQADQLPEGADTLAQINALSKSIGRAAVLVRAQVEALAFSEELTAVNRKLVDARARMMNADSMESMAAISAGIAHELNNPLTLISGRAQIMLSQAQDADLRDGLLQIIDQAHAASDIIRDLQEISRPLTAVPRQTDLAGLLQSLRGELIHGSLLTEDQLVLDIPPGELPVQFDPDLLKHIFRELLENARESTDPQIRRVTIKAHAIPAEEQVAVSVLDNGRGMKPEVLDRAMDPFFSHRPAGRSRGMGLTRVRHWLGTGGGRIQIRSAADRGTQVDVLLPAHA